MKQIGIHPTNALQYSTMDMKQVHDQVMNIATTHRDLIVAIGECGLDALRVEFCPLDVQIEIWKFHFSLAKELSLPMFIHSRQCEQLTLSLLNESLSLLSSNGAVVHSFDGNLNFAKDILDLSPNFFIGINGCSLKSKENCQVVAELPLDRLLVESDAPWCEIKPTSHAYPLLFQTSALGGPLHTMASVSDNENRVMDSAKQDSNLIDSSKESDAKALGTQESSSKQDKSVRKKGPLAATQQKPKKEGLPWSEPEVNKPERLKGMEGQATVKGRNEPRNVLDVIRVLAVLKQTNIERVAQIVSINSKKLFTKLDS